jgi:cobalamin biosynthesis Co2+ chelatase CbiK
VRELKGHANALVLALSLQLQAVEQPPDKVLMCHGQGHTIAKAYSRSSTYLPHTASFN